MHNRHAGAGTSALSLAHGRFDHVAHATSWQMWLNRHRNTLAASAAGGLAAAGLAWALGKRPG
jgi:hypothetical protein